MTSTALHNTSADMGRRHTLCGEAICRWYELQGEVEGRQLPTCYLLDLGGGHLYSVLAAVEFLQLMENDSANIQVQSHADGVRSDKDVKAVVGLIEQLSLVSPHLWRKRPINDAALVVGPPLDLHFDVEDVFP